jgi:hypothetical protein
MSQNTAVPLITIPGVVASHVLGTSNTELGSGELTLAPPPDAKSDAQPAVSRRPVLTLTVGKAALPLYETTTFGTVAGDERIYVFRPELGDDIKG